MQKIKCQQWAIYEDGDIQTYWDKEVFDSENEAEYAASELAKEEPFVNHEYYVDIYPAKENFIWNGREKFITGGNNDHNQKSYSGIERKSITHK